jgi:hypothetical protein
MVICTMWLHYVDVESGNLKYKTYRMRILLIEICGSLVL